MAELISTFTDSHNTFEWIYKTRYSKVYRNSPN